MTASLDAAPPRVTDVTGGAVCLSHDRLICSAHGPSVLCTSNHSTHNGGAHAHSVERSYTWPKHTFATKEQSIQVPKPVCSSAMASSTTQATVSRSDKLGTFVQLRASASEVSDFVHGGVIFNGSTVQVLSEQGVFCKVQFSDASKSQTLVGFVKKQHLNFGIPAIQARMPSPPPVPKPPSPPFQDPHRPPVVAPAPASKLPNATVARKDGGAAFVKLRLHPTAASSFVDGLDIPNGTKVAILESGDDFTEVQYIDGGGRGYKGFVKTQYLEMELSSKDYVNMFNKIRESGSIEDRWKCLKAYIEAKQREVPDYHLQDVRPMEELMSMKALEKLKQRALE